MITGKKKLLEWYRSQADTFPYWFIARTTDKQDYINTCPNVEGYAATSGFTDLSGAIDLLNADTRYYICLRDRFDQSNKAHHRSTFFDSEKLEVPVHRDERHLIAGIDSSGFEEKVAAKVSEQMSVFKKEWENEQKIKDLEEKIKELKNEKSEKPDYIGAILEKHGEAILEAFMPKPELQPVTITGFDTQNTNKMSDQELLEVNLEKWSKLDKDYLKVINRIVTLLEKNPKKYRMAKSML